MKTISKLRADLVDAWRTDTTIQRVRGCLSPASSRHLPSAIAEYLADKLPVAQWLPHYDFRRWLARDAIAGLTMGVMLIPQGLAYAKIAHIPVEHGLYSSWLPSALYFLLGTSKDVSSGPTSVLGLFTAQTVADLAQQGYEAAHVASAMAFLVGVYALLVGLLRLGFLLDFVSGPVLTGWISAVALVIALGQVGPLVGIDDSTSIASVLAHLDRVRGPTLAIGLACLAALYALERVGRVWGQRRRWLRVLTTSRAVLVLVVSTVVSFLVNRRQPDDTRYTWAVTQVDTHGLLPPRTHDVNLIRQLAVKSVAPLVAMSVEHLGVGKAFALRNGYAIDKSQELIFLGASNIANSFFGAMACGGAMSRTAVNSECGVRSPANFLFTAGFIVLTLYELAPALYWIPKATLSAIIIMAVAHLISSPRLFYRYWRMSFIDFVASMLGFWVTLFTTTEIGLAVSVSFSIVYTLLRLAFPSWVGLSHMDTEGVDKISSPEKQQQQSHYQHLGSQRIHVPAEAFLVRFTQDLIFSNAERVKNAIVDTIKMHYEPAPSDTKTLKDGSWNAARHKRIDRIRRRNNIIPLRGDVVNLHHVVLDFSMTSFIDVTGLLYLIELKMELRRYIGHELQFRFTHMPESVYQRFRRSEWEFAHQGEQRTGEVDTIYSSLDAALFHGDGNDEKLYNMSDKVMEGRL